MGAARCKLLFEEVSIHNHYCVTEKEIGKGKYATCFEAKARKTGEKVAVKALYRCARGFHMDKIGHEVFIMRAMGSHPNLVEFKAAYPGQSAVYIVEELVLGGELLDRISGATNFTEGHATGIMEQLLSGVVHLHSLGITHRDLKPANILMGSSDPSSPDYDRIKICDFGLSHKNMAQNDELTSGSNVMKTICGSPTFMAPEIAAHVIQRRHAAAAVRAGAPPEPLDEDQEFTYSSNVDVWSCAVIYYVILSGYQPFANWGELARGEYSLDTEEFDLVSQGAKDLIASMLVRDPKERPSAAECLTHPYLATSRLGSNSGSFEETLASTSTLIAEPSDTGKQGQIGLKAKILKVLSPGTLRRGGIEDNTLVVDGTVSRLGVGSRHDPGSPISRTGSQSPDGSQPRRSPGVNQAASRSPVLVQSHHGSPLLALDTSGSPARRGHLQSPIPPDSGLSAPSGRRRSSKGIEAHSTATRDSKSLDVGACASSATTAQASPHSHGSRGRSKGRSGDALATLDAVVTRSASTLGPAVHWEDAGWKEAGAEANRKFPSLSPKLGRGRRRMMSPLGVAKAKVVPSRGAVE